jgi:uncharacterized SAM-binding protein YcdF (DUF218 family)
MAAYVFRLDNMVLDVIRALGPLGEPLGMLWLVNLAAAGFLFWRRKWQGAIVLAVLAGLSSIIGSTSIPRRLLASLERPYVRSDSSNLPAGDAVIMLGGTHRPSQHDLFGFDLNHASDRAIMAMELLRQRKANALVVGGGTYTQNGKRLGAAPLLQSWFSAWGYSGVPIICLENCNNTHQEAVRVQALAKEHGWQRVLLVTSAFHMPRAEAVFKKAGVPVTPVACDFRAVGIPPDVNYLGPVPKLQNFEELGLYAHEQLGWLLYRWRGWVGKGNDKPS